MMRKKDLIVLVDIDGVLSDLQEHLVDEIIERGYEFDLSAMEDYETHTGILNVPDTFSIMDSIFKEDDFWLSCPMIENSYEGLFYLCKTFDTYIATSPWDERNKITKKLWIEEKYPFFNSDKIIYSNKKWLLKGDVIIEDKPETIQKCSDLGMVTVCKLQPYNINENPTAFLFNWKDIYDTMDCILKEEIEL